MRCLNRNKRTFWYANFVEREDITVTDEYGNTLGTGEHRIDYGEPVKCRANISAATGESSDNVFGGFDAYDRVIVLDDPDTPIDEYSILWVETTLDHPHDYVVRKVARGLDHACIAISKVVVQ